MEQRYQEEARTETKQYGPKVEAVLSGVLVAASLAIFFIFNCV